MAFSLAEAVELTADKKSPPKSEIESKYNLRPTSTQENKHGIGPDRNKIETAHGLSVPIFCSSLNL